MTKKTSKSVGNTDNRFSRHIRDLSEQARELGLPDLDYLDEIPDNDAVDESIPFPYGGGGKFNTWNLK